MNIRPTVAVVDRSAIRYNFLKIEEKISNATKVLAVVKADAYGHGAVEVAKTLESSGCEFLGVALCEEGIELRKAGIRVPIVILSGIYKDHLEELLQFNLTPTIFDTYMLYNLNETARMADKSVPVHIKVDTGMGRLGFPPEQIASLFKELDRCNNIEVEGLLSHFADVEEEDKCHSMEQLNCFNKVIKLVKGMGCEPKFIHMANSAAIVDYPSSHFNLVRPGIILYGGYPSSRFKRKITLRPAMTVTTEIIQLKKVSTGFPVGYGRRHIVDKETLVATIPIGYADGYPRRLSGKGEVLIRGKRAGVIGMVCMDLTMVDVSDIEGVSIGDKVVIVGRQGGQEITVEDIAEKVGSISYEVFCGVGKRIPRVYV